VAKQIALLKDFPSWAGYLNDTATPDWECGPCGAHRDSDTLARSNYDEALHRLMELDPEEKDWTNIRFSHFAIGWVEEIFTRPGSEANRIAHVMREDLDNYPSLNDERLSEYEAEEEAYLAEVNDRNDTPIQESKPPSQPLAPSVTANPACDIKLGRKLTIRKLASKHLETSDVPVGEWCDRNPCKCASELADYQGNPGVIVSCPWTDLGGES
jgi:hypothetical protein